jgi:hypothetical protein
MSQELAQELFEVFCKAHAEAGVEIEQSFSELEDPEREGWLAVARHFNQALLRKMFSKV